MRITLAVIVILGGLLAGLLADETKTEAIYGIYNIVPADGDIEIILPSGKRMPIHIEDKSNLAATRAMSNLRYSVYISTRNLSPPPNEKSNIYFIGRVIGVIPHVIATKNTEGARDRLKFELMGWYIRVPYIEYPQVSPDQEEKWKPVVRYTLEAKDFKVPEIARNIHYDRKLRIYWVGLKPNGR